MKRLIDKSHLNNFDFIRFIAAVFVIITHSWPLTGRPEIDYLTFVIPGISLSYLGLSAFFIISGFLIAQSANSSSSYKNYLWKRCVRIFPGLLTVLILSMVILGPMLTILSWQKYFFNKELYTYIINLSLIKMQWELPGLFERNPYSSVVNGSLWTLVYEFLMYIGVLFVHKIGMIKNGIFLVGSFIALLIFKVYMTFNIIPTKFIFYLPNTHLYLNPTIDFSLYFCAGMILFAYSDKIKYELSYFIMIAVIWVISFFTQFTFCFHHLCLPYLLLYIAYAPVLSCFNNFAKYGDLSYGMYIYAFPIQQAIVLLMGKEISIPAMILFSLLFTFPFAYLSWHLIEKRALRYKKLIS